MATGFLIISQFWIQNRSDYNVLYLFGLGLVGFGMVFTFVTIVPALQD